MKKHLIYLLLAAMTFSLTACKPTVSEKPQTPASTEAPGAQIANPWSDLDNLADAEKKAGFSYKFGEKINSEAYTASTFRAMEGMIDIGYDADGKEFTIRQAPKTKDDITGSTLIYPYDSKYDDCGLKDIRCQGTKDTVSIVSFSDNEFSYVIYADKFSYESVFAVIGEMTGNPSTLFTAKPDATEEEPNEGAPVVDENRKIDETAIDGLAIAGLYKGESNSVDISMYTSVDEDSNRVGVAEIKNAKGKVICSGEIIFVADNWYEFLNADANFTVYTENDTLNLDLYLDGKHTDYCKMTKHYES